MNEMNTLELEREQNIATNNSEGLRWLVRLLGFGIVWAFMSALIVGCIAAAVWTVIPTEWLAWGSGVMNRIGYISHCSFAPISTLILLISAIAGIALASRINSERRLGQIVFGGAATGLILGSLIAFDIIMFIGMGTGLGIGLGIGLIFEFVNFFREKRGVRV